MSSTAEVKMSSNEEKTKVSFYFRDKGKVKPRGFNDIGINDDVTVIVTGKIDSMSDKPDSWDKGKRFEMEIKSCQIVPKATKVSLDDALQDAKKKI